MVVDTFGIVLGIIVVVGLILMVSSNIRKESIKETVSSLMTWIKEQFK